MYFALIYGMFNVILPFLRVLQGAGPYFNAFDPLFAYFFTFPENMTRQTPGLRLRQTPSVLG